MTNATNPLVCRVSDETLAAFEMERAKTPLSKNQYLKMLVLSVACEMEPPDTENWDELIDWLRGK